MCQMPRRANRVFHTPFQEWIHTAIDRLSAESGEKVDLKWVCEQAGLNYENIWKHASGNPAKYQGRKGLGFETVRAIGKVLGDIEGAIAAAFPLGDDENVMLTEIVREQDEEYLLEKIATYNGSNPTLNGFKGFLLASATAREIPPEEDYIPEVDGPREAPQP